MVKEGGFFARWNSRKGHVLPTYKSELSGESRWVGLHSSDDVSRPELSRAGPPVELDGTWTQHVKRKPIPSKDGTRNIAPVGKQGGSPEPRDPPPVPYASKPRPS